MGQTTSRLDSLQTVYEQETNDSLQVVYAFDLTRQLHREAHNEATEYAYAETAIEKALQLQDTLLYARALDNLGLLHRYHQRYTEAMALHKKAFTLVKDKAVPPLYKMIFANNAGVAGRYSQQYDTAVSFYMKALQLAEAENDLKNIAISSNGIGNALANLPKRQEEALPYFKRSLEAEQERNNSLGVAMNYLSISDYYIEKEDYSTALAYLNDLLALNKKRNDAYGLAITYEFMGKAYLKKGSNLPQAATYFKKALHRFTQLQDTHKQAELKMQLGTIAYRQNNLPKAEAYYRESLALAKTLNQHRLLMENSLRLSEIYEANRYPTQALRYYKQGKAYEDSIKLTEQNVQIEALTRRYDLEKKENHIQLLQKDKDLQQTLLNNQKQQLERRRTFLVLLGVAFLFLFIIFVLQYRNHRIRKKTDALILQEEKEKMNAIYERNLARAETLVNRLRINPHFLFNSLTAITYLIQSKQNEKAIKYLVVFSRYTRMVLETSQHHVVPLPEELKLAEYYLTLEENRFEKDFTYSITGGDAPELKGLFIPPLLLQPFIENAIWHGLLPSERDEKTLHISLAPVASGIEISIDDNGVGRKNPDQPPAQKPHTSMGMQIIKERIALYNKSYSGTITCDIIDKKDDAGKPEGTRVVVTLINTDTATSKPIPAPSST